MTVIAFIDTSTFILGGIFIAVAFAYLIPPLLAAKERRRRSFKTDIRSGLESGLLQWEDLDVLAQRWKQSRADIHWILSDLLHESLSAKDEKAR